jgi:hypothetical protein
MQSPSTFKRESKITVPMRANPLARLVFAEMKSQRVTYGELEWRSGVLISTFKAWRTDNSPGLLSIEAALGALGWALVPVPELRTLPPHVRERLAEIGQLFETDQQALAAAVLATAEWRQRASSSSYRLAAAARETEHIAA